MRRLASIGMVVMAAACGKPRDFPQEEKTLATAKVGGVELRVGVLRWGTHTPFGNGPGRGGFLDPANDSLMLRGYVVQPSDATFYAQLLEKRWESRREPTAITKWEDAWKSASAERCDVDDGVAFAISAPGVDEPTWIALKIDGGKIIRKVETQAPNCATLRDWLR